jgi:hypothetical protein
MAMERIIAGRFPTKDEADAAAVHLEHDVQTSDICIFHNNAPGQHDAYAVGGVAAGGDEDEDPGAAGAGASAANSAVRAGIAAGAIGSLAGPVVALVAAGIGAYSGAAAGAMEEFGHHEAGAPQRRPGGVILSVRIADPANETRVIATLRHQGAADIERADGQWLDGDWTDFNPVAVPQLVEAEAA